MTNRKHEPRRPLTQEERLAAFERERERIDRDLYRKIVAWAKTWERALSPAAGAIAAASTKTPAA